MRAACVLLEAYLTTKGALQSSVCEFKKDCSKVCYKLFSFYSVDAQTCGNTTTQHSLPGLCRTTLHRRPVPSPFSSRLAAPSCTINDRLRLWLRSL